MAGINDITQGSYYRGDPGLGGGFAPAIQLDTNPIDRLANFTFQRDNALYRQKQFDDAKAAEEMANITSYDVTSPLETQNQYLKEKYQQIIEFVKNNPNSLNYGKDNQGFQTRLKLENDFKTARKAATQNDIIYEKRKAEAQREPDARKKSLMEAQLEVDKDDFFSQPDYWKNNTFLTQAPLEKETYQVPDVDVTVNEEIIQLPNSDVIEKVKFISPNSVKTSSDILVFNFPKSKLDVNSPQFLAMSPAKRKLALAREDYRLSEINALRSMSSVVSGLYADIKKTRPDFVLTEESLGQLPVDGTAKSIFSAIIGYNREVDALNAILPNLKSGDPTKKNIYGVEKKINIEDGIDESELVSLKVWQKQGGFIKSNEKDIKQTDNAIQREQMAQNESQFRREMAFKWTQANKPTDGTNTTQAAENIASFIEPVTRAATIASEIPKPSEEGKVEKVVVNDESIYKTLGLSLNPQGAQGYPDRVEMEKDYSGNVTMKVYRGSGTQANKPETISQSDFIRKVPRNAGGLNIADNNSQYYFKTFNSLSDRFNNKDWSFKLDDAFGTGQSGQQQQAQAGSSGTGTNNWKSRASKGN